MDWKLRLQSGLSVLHCWAVSWQHCHCTPPQNWPGIFQVHLGVSLSLPSGLQTRGNPESPCSHICPPILYSPISESSLKTQSLLSTNPPMASHAVQGVQHSYWVLFSLPPSMSLFIQGLMLSIHSLLSCDTGFLKYISYAIP